MYFIHPVGRLVFVWIMYGSFGILMAELEAQGRKNVPPLTLDVPQDLAQSQPT